MSQNKERKRVFLCHNSEDSKFVIEVAKHLKRNLDDVFYYEDYQRQIEATKEAFTTQINRKILEFEVILIFIGENFSHWQKEETTTAITNQKEDQKKIFFTIVLNDNEEFPVEIANLKGFPKIKVKGTTNREAYNVAREIVQKLDRKWYSVDDLPFNSHLFSYEKDIINHFISQIKMEKKFKSGESELKGDLKIYEDINKKILEGCPSQWPEVTRWDEKKFENKLSQEEIGKWRPEDAKVLAAALSHYHDLCLKDNQLTFMEGGPRQFLSFPKPNNDLNVAVLVSGGIAPGINAVIDGITQRHMKYAQAHHYNVSIYGFKNGFHAFEALANSYVMLKKDGIPGPNDLITSNHANEGGSMLGTSRVKELLEIETRERELSHIVTQLFNWGISILYIIGGDGSMKAAHAIWNHAKLFSEGRDDEWKLSVVAIPKTMDNDILWVWQTFGFLSAVEKAREIIENLANEVKSNPRICVLQLFGSDSGFVVSHAVLASRTGICDATLIPEVNFNMKALASSLKKRVAERRERIPYGLIVMAETAIPTDAMNYVEEKESIYKIGLSEDEKKAIREFEDLRKAGKSIEGQTNDFLRNAGLKIVSRGLINLLPKERINEIDWNKKRVFTNEPRHLLRAIPPSSSDIIFGHRLGTLAVDNVLAGYTDFMISQWLTEYVLVPLKLVVLGRKRIPKTGVFWKSVMSKIDQPIELDE